VEKEQLDEHIRQAIRHFWRTRMRQQSEQKRTGRTDQGSRGAATGAAQMDGFISLIRDIIIQSGVDEFCVHVKRSVELPGYYRPTKKWDLLVIENGHLVAALEAKSHIGPSFGNNFNNRVEEALGSALDFWTAFREGKFGQSQEPWLGWLLLLEDCDKSREPVSVNEPHFESVPGIQECIVC
jgi:hypothetical protein